MKSDFNNATAPLDQSLADWVVISGRGIRLFNAFAQRRGTDTSFGDINDASSIGTCTLYKDSNAQIRLTAADAGVTPGSAVCVLNKKTVAGSERASATSGLFDRDQITRAIVLLPTSGTSFSYTAMTLRETQEYGKDASGGATNIVSIGTAQIGSNATGTVSYALSAGEVTAAAINGYMPARVDDDGMALTDYEAWAINYNVTTESGGVNKYAFSGSIDARKNGASLGAVSIDNTSYVRATNNKGKYHVTEGLLSVGVSAGSSTVKGSLSLNSLSTDLKGNHYLPTYVKFSGSFTNQNGASFNGAITMLVLNYKNYDRAAPQSASNYPTGNVSFTGNLKVSGLKPLAVTFAARNTGYQKAEYNGTYSDQDNLISFSGDNSLPRMVNLSASSGISLKWVDGASYLDVFQNNSKVALINVQTKVINYADGSFETFK